MKNRIIVISTLFAGLFLLNSCLKDTADYWPDQVSGKMYATVLLPALQSKTLKPTADTVDFSFMINIATDQPPTTDVTITVEVDPTAVTNYNTMNKTAYKPYPSFKILNPTIIIKAGTRTAYVNGKIWGADQLSACDQFIAATTIKSVSDPNIMIPSNMKSYVLSLPISNPYEGLYHSSGTFVHPVNGTRVIDEDKTLSTVDCKTVKGFVGDLGAYDAKFTVNDDNSVTVTGSISATQPLIQSGVNKYDPATRTFTVNYYYVGSGGNRVISEVLVRLD